FSSRQSLANTSAPLMPGSPKDPGLGFWLSESGISFGRAMDGILGAPAAALASPTMPATTAPAPASKKERRERSAVCLVVFLSAFALWTFFMVDSPCLGE